MDVIAYDPFISVAAAWQLSRNIKRAENIDEIFSTCDYITVHVPLTKDTEGMLNKDAFEKMKDGVRIFNFSRGELVNENDLEEALQQGKIASYTTDFPTERILTMENAYALPHLGASTKEAEENCAYMAAKQIKEYLETGNITNSVNYPNLSMPYVGKNRLTVLHENKPKMVGPITGLLAKLSLNIDNMVNGSRGDWAYTMIDIDEELSESLIKEVKYQVRQIDGVVRVRFL